MKPALAAFAATALAALALPAFDSQENAEPALATAGSVPAYYRLDVAGRRSGCTLARRGADVSGRAEVALEGDCRGPALSLGTARYWREQEGTVLLEAADGRIVAEFFAADGVAYEALRPARPLMALVVQ